MNDTENLTLPLLQPAQAQKHVTVNEALSRIDALVHLVLVSRSVAVPPVIVPEGACYGVPVGAVNAWAGHDGKVAFGENGGWAFAGPKAGWRARILDSSQDSIHDGSDWRDGMVTLSAHGAGLRCATSEIDHSIAAGATSNTAIVIPGNAMVMGVTSRVLSNITGALADWNLGTAGAPDRFGSGLGKSAGSWGRGMLSQPTTYYTATPLLLTAVGGNFSGGQVRLAVHYFEITLPEA